MWGLFTKIQNQKAKFFTKLLWDTMLLYPYVSFFEIVTISLLRTKGQIQDDFWVGFDLIKLLYLLCIFRQTGLSKKCRPRSHATEQSESTLFATHPYQICRIEEKNNSNNTFNKYICNRTLEVRDTVYWNYCGKGEKLLLRSNFSSFPKYFFYLLLHFHV